MRAGSDYYEAMDASLRDHDGPASTTRAFREPLTFWFWASTGAFRPGVALALVVACGVLIAHLVDPAWGLAVGGLFLVSTFTFDPAFWGFVQVWVVPILLLVVWAARGQRWGLAAAVGLVAALMVEQATLILLGGGIAAIAAGHSWKPWAAASIAWDAYYLWHLTQVVPHLVSEGTEAPLVGTGSLTAAVVMAGPHTGVGILIVITVLVTRRFQPLWWLCLPMIVAIPLSDLLVGRGYWGYLVLPLAVTLFGLPESEPRHRTAASVDA